MSSLQRYKKSGGFYQLLSLIETFGPQKKEKFLEMIEAESPAWARALREKMLTLERIFTWSDQVVIEVFKALPPKSQAFALTGLKDEYKAKITPLMSSSENRRLNDVLTESKPKPEEVQATLAKMVELARKMLHDRELHAEKIDETLIIPEGFESKLEEQGAHDVAHAIVNESAAAAIVQPSSGSGHAPGNGGGGGNSAEIVQLQRSLSVMAKENKTLKDEVRVLRDKLEAIRKIA